MWRFDTWGIEYRGRSCFVFFRGGDCWSWDWWFWKCASHLKCFSRLCNCATKHVPHTICVYIHIVVAGYRAFMFRMYCLILWRHILIIYKIDMYWCKHYHCFEMSRLPMIIFTLHRTWTSSSKLARDFTLSEGFSFGPFQSRERISTIERFSWLSLIPHF